ncbi:MAG: hypothetical protein ACK47B_01275 [Armatimonadota bacterium]
MEKRRRKTWLWVGGGLFGLLLALLVGGFGYWQYAAAVPEFRLPPDTLPAPRGYLQGRAASQELLRSRSRVPNTWPNGSTTELEAAVAPVRPALQRLRASFGEEWRVPTSILTAARFQDYGAFREAARCFTVEAILAERRGDHDAALQHRIDALELGVRLRRGDGIMGILVGGAVNAIGVAGIETLPERASPAALETALTRLRRIEADWPSLHQSLEIEALVARADLARYLHELNARSLPQQWQALDDLGDFGSGEKLRLLLTPRRAAAARVDAYYRASVAELMKPPGTRVKVSVPDDPWVKRFCTVLPAAYGTRDRSQVALLVGALAVERWQREHGRYPRSMEELSGKWLPEAPVDAWERPLVYRLRNGRPLLYSLGPDGIDDGGRSLPPGGHLDDGARGDLAWGQLSPRRGGSGS